MKKYKSVIIAVCVAVAVLAVGLIPSLIRDNIEDPHKEETTAAETTAAETTAVITTKDYYSVDTRDPNDEWTYNY